MPKDELFLKRDGNTKAICKENMQEGENSHTLRALFPFVTAVSISRSVELCKENPD